MLAIIDAKLPLTAIQFGPTVNAVAASVSITAAELAVVSVGDTVDFWGEVYTKVASDPGENEFTDAAGLAALISGNPAWVATESDGAISIVSAVKGVEFNNNAVIMRVLSGETAGGGEAAKSTVTIPAADLAQLTVDDQVFFGDLTLVKVAETPGVGQFVDTAGLVSVLDALEDWTAAASEGAVVITAAENGVANDGVEAGVQMSRISSDGVNGTVGSKGDIRLDTDALYVATDDNTIADANWKSVALT
jgi:hypothetical protein